MKKKLTQVINVEKDVIEYNIFTEQVDDGTRYSLCLSNAPMWSSRAKGEERLAIIDTDNGLKTEKKFQKLDYDIADYMLILLMVIRDKGNNQENLEIRWMQES